MDTTISGAELAEYVDRAAAYRIDGGTLGRDKQGRYWASSTSQPVTWHAVTLASCSCRGFIHHGECKHRSALMVAVILKGAPEPGAPAPAAAARCASCDGVGEVQYTRQTGPRSFGLAWQTCPCCHGHKVAA